MGWKCRRGMNMFDDKEIVRMTIVYKDGSMTILTKNKDGTLNVDRREKWWQKIVLDAKGVLERQILII